MNVPRFPPPPNLSSKVIDDDELTSRRTKALPVSRETRSSRRGDAIVRGGVGPARGPGPGPGEGEGACDTRGRGAVDGYRQRGFTSLKKTNGRFYIVDNLIHPHILKSSRRKIKSKRVTKLTVKMTERDSPRDDDPDDDVVCANGMNFISNIQFFFSPRLKFWTKVVFEFYQIGAKNIDIRIVQVSHSFVPNSQSRICSFRSISVFYIDHEAVYRV